MNGSSILISSTPYQISKQDPLSNLYQLDDEINFPLKKEVLILIKRMLYNVEEFYQLRDMIKEMMDKDEIDKIKSTVFFKNLLSEVDATQFMHTSTNK